jgi:predicted ATP-dependent endonuclease of OLD family
MIKLKEVKINKYKSIESQQVFNVEEDITVLVGMNESGKTSILEAIAKTNYFTKDDKFKFDTTHDYPRKEKKALDKSGENPLAVTTIFTITDELYNQIEAELGSGVLKTKEYSYNTYYDNETYFSSDLASHVDKDKFFKDKFEELGIEDSEVLKKLSACKNKVEFDQFIKTLPDDELDEDDEEEDNGDKSEETFSLKDSLKDLAKYFDISKGWNNAIAGYIAKAYLTPNRPKFLYYDEYYSLPSEIEIEKLKKAKITSDELKTAQALFDLADINIDELLDANDFEDYKAELEATQINISDELFKYWYTNENLQIEFDIDKQIERQTNSYNKEDKIVKHLLKIRVKNARNRVSLPLKNRSKGFNWFFSFLVWFKKIQEDKNNNYILLLDEPGLNLHATAQQDLLNFFEDLSKEYQIIFSTHSPFMIDSSQLSRVRTVVETSSGTKVSDTIQEKDPKTLFPLQAALGYNVAQNLFISKNNLIVEGVSDLIYLTVISDLLKAEGRIGLDEEITIVPVGGLEKVTTFISLLGANKLKIVCLLDSFNDPKGKAKLEDLVKGNIIKDKNVKFFDEFVTADKADIEDLFEKSEYLQLFNEAFNGKYTTLTESALDARLPTVIFQINKNLGIERFNHYTPAKILAQKGVVFSFFSTATLERFENVFKSINKLF